MKRTKTILPALLALAALACLALPASAPARPRQQPLYWGAWIGNQLTGEQPPWDMGAVSKLEGTLGKGLSLLEFASPFAQCGASTCSFYAFPTTQMQSIRNYGAIPLLSWSSAGSGLPEQPDFQLADVISGRYDSYIRRFAREAREWGHPFFLRFDWEMNGFWFPWAEGLNGNRADEFVAAWRHVHDIFTSVGATNASWVWCPYAFQPEKARPLRPLYPGSRYVDWTCLDGFNWGHNGFNPGPWKTFEKVFGRAYGEVTKEIAPAKPMLIGETGTNGAARARAQWVRQMFSALPRQFPSIHGLIWYDQTDRGVKWPLEIFPGVAGAFARGLQAHPVRANIYQGLESSPIPPPH